MRLVGHHVPVHDRISHIVRGALLHMILRHLEEKEISTQDIGELVMNKLKDMDAVAYVRFASVYREFKDINTFMDELKKVLDNN